MNKREIPVIFPHRPTQPECLPPPHFFRKNRCEDDFTAVSIHDINCSLKKHFALNNQEYKRCVGSSQADERTMREIYLAAFEKPVREGKPDTVMCAYNQVNGTFCSDHSWLLTEVLRKQWGFQGTVITD